MPRPNPSSQRHLQSEKVNPDPYVDPDPESWVDGVKYGVVMLLVGGAGMLFWAFPTHDPYKILLFLFLIGAGFSGAVVQFAFACLNRSAGWLGAVVPLTMGVLTIVLAILITI